MDSKILITGGHGFIGSHLVEQLVGQGNRVSCLVRPKSNLRWINNLNVDLVTGDLLNPPSLLSAVKGKEIIFHCAAALSGRTGKDFDRTNHLGTLNLLEAIKVVNPNIHRVVVVSSTSAAGPSPSKKESLTERDPCNPVSNYGKSKLRMEEMIRERYTETLPITIIRPPMVFGPRDNKLLPLFKLARFGLHMEFPKNRILNMVYVRDLVRGMHAAAISERASGETYFILDPHSYKWRTFAKHIAGSLNRPAIHVPVPKRIFTSVANGVDFLSKFRKKSPFFGKDKLEDIKHPYLLYSSAKARRDFHFETYTPLETAVKETTDWYRSNKWI